MALLHTFIRVLESLKIFTKTGACFWSCLPLPLAVFFIYFWFIYVSEGDLHEKVWYLVLGLHVAEVLYMTLIPMAIRKLAPQTSVQTCLTHLRSPNRIIWASASLIFILFVSQVYSASLGADPRMDFTLTAINFLSLFYFPIFGVFTGIICKSFGVKCR